MLYPFLMLPCYKDYIWGGRNLEKLGKRLPDGNVAEAWEVSAREEGESRIANGCLAGKGLREAIEMYPRYIMGEAFMANDRKVFPLLFKLIDANEALSVQVHPGDVYAQAYENEPNGKHEAWYVLDAEPGAEIVYGILPGISREHLELMARENCIKDCLNTVCVQTGDIIDITPGTLHAIGKGIVLAEIQQNSNLTYRIYDYDRKDAQGKKRELHIEKAFDVINYEPSAPFTSGTLSCKSGGSAITSMIQNQCFNLDIMDIDGVIEMNAEGDRFYILFIAEGEVSISYNCGSLIAKKGESILIPAALGRYAMKGECRVLSMYVPSGIKCV